MEDFKKILKKENKIKRKKLIPESDLKSLLEFKILKDYNSEINISIYNTNSKQKLGYIYLEIIPLRNFQKIDYLKELTDENENTKIIWLSKIYIFEQNRGIGTFVLKNLDKILKKYISVKSHYLYILEADSYNYLERNNESLKKFYTTIGFKEIKSKENYMIKKIK